MASHSHMESRQSRSYKSDVCAMDAGRSTRIKERAWQYSGNLLPSTHTPEFNTAYNICTFLVWELPLSALLLEYTYTHKAPHVPSVRIDSILSRSEHHDFPWHFAELKVTESNNHILIKLHAIDFLRLGSFRRQPNDSGLPQAKLA